MAAGGWRTRLAVAAVLVVLGVLGGGPALAGDGFYANFSVEGVFVTDRDITGPTSTRLPAGGLGATVDTGYGGGFALGYDFGTLRLEGEMRFAQSGLDRLTSAAGAALTGDGTVQSLSYMANAHLDFPLGPVVFSVGGGAGIAIVSYENTDLGGTPLVDDGDGVPAYQALAGLEYPLGPRFSLLVGYRYFVTGDLNLEDVDGRRLSADYESHSARIGLRVRF